MNAEPTPSAEAQGRSNWAVPRLIVRSSPGRNNPNNPYVDLFYDAMNEHGIWLSGDFTVDIEWLRRSAHSFDLLHFHWPEVFWRVESTRPKSTLRRKLRDMIPGLWRLFATTDAFWSTPAGRRLRRPLDKFARYREFVAFLDAARRENLRIMWTLHNVESHEQFDWIDRMGYAALAKRADLVIVHSATAEQEFERRYEVGGQLVVMPHGNYAGVYPPARSKNAILAELGLDDDLPIVSCLGMMRNYKGLNVACDAVEALGGRVRLVCAGLPHPTFDIEQLRRRMDDLPGSVLIARFLSDQQFADLVSISDAVLLPYRKITGSGALLAALTLGRGVVASDLPYFREVLEQDPHAGRLTPAGDPKGLAQAIIDFLELPTEVRAAAAHRLAQRYAWADVVVPVARALVPLCASRSTQALPSLR